MAPDEPHRLPIRDRGVHPERTGEICPHTGADEGDRVKTDSHGQVRPSRMRCAFRYLYAGWENADSILTTDKNLIDQSSQNKKLPKAECPSTLKARMKGHPWFDSLHNKVFGPSS